MILVLNFKAKSELEKIHGPVVRLKNYSSSMFIPDSFVLLPRFLWCCLPLPLVLPPAASGASSLRQRLRQRKRQHQYQTQCCLWRSLNHCLWCRQREAAPGAVREATRRQRPDWRAPLCCEQHVDEFTLSQICDNNQVTKTNRCPYAGNVTDLLRGGFNGWKGKGRS